MFYSTVSLQAATSTENLQALEEVKDFRTTDLGRGGKERWTYHLLQEAALDEELHRMSDATSSRSVDIVTFQPCSAYANLNQDRYSVEEWELPGGVWQFTAIYDGHCGHDTVNYVQKRLPLMVKTSLQALLHRAPVTSLRSELVSEALCNTVMHLDESIRNDLLNFLPHDHLIKMSDAEISRRISQRYSDWNIISARCTQGSTLLLALTDPFKRNLWVLNLGDSAAVLGARSSSGQWSAMVVNPLHNGNNPKECRRVQREHPSEKGCIADNRVIGFLAPTRALGDTWLKIPSVYTRRALAPHSQDWLPSPQVAEYASRILTPPYVSNVPEVFHYSLDLSKQDVILILSSDGLQDLYDNHDIQMSEQQMADRWVRIVGRRTRSTKDVDLQNNLALRLLRDAIGGNNIELVSRNLTLEMEDKWMDDVTILVQRFR